MRSLELPSHPRGNESLSSVAAVQPLGQLHLLILGFHLGQLCLLILVGLLCFFVLEVLKRPRGPQYFYRLVKPISNKSKAPNKRPKQPQIRERRGTRPHCTGVKPRPLSGTACESRHSRAKRPCSDDCIWISRSGSNAAVTASSRQVGDGHGSQACIKDAPPTRRTAINARLHAFCRILESLPGSQRNTTARSKVRLHECSTSSPRCASHKRGK